MLINERRVNASPDLVLARIRDALVVRTSRMKLNAGDNGYDPRRDDNALKSGIELLNAPDAPEQIGEILEPDAVTAGVPVAEYTAGRIRETRAVLSRIKDGKGIGPDHLRRTTQLFSAMASRARKQHV